MMFGARKLKCCGYRVVKSLMLSLYHNCYSTTIRLYTTRLQRKTDMFIFARVESRRMEAGARDTS